MPAPDPSTHTLSSTLDRWPTFGTPRTLHRPHTAPCAHCAQFEIEFECIAPIPDDIEWKLTCVATPASLRLVRRPAAPRSATPPPTPGRYVGSAESDDYDQLLDSVDVGPMQARTSCALQGVWDGAPFPADRPRAPPSRGCVQVGPYKFVFQAEAPDPRRIPPHDILGVTVILLSCFYHDKEFIRVRTPPHPPPCRPPTPIRRPRAPRVPFSVPRVAISSIAVSRGQLTRAHALMAALSALPPPPARLRWATTSTRSTTRPS